MNEPSREQLAVARRVGHKLGRNVHGTGVLDEADVHSMAVEALLVLIQRDRVPDEPAHLYVALHSRTVDRLREEGVLIRDRTEDGDVYLQFERATLDELEPHQREILAATFDLDLDAKQIAVARGTTRATIYHLRSRALRTLAGRITSRQLDVLRLSADGLSADETATELGLSLETVKTHRKHIIAALRTRNISHAVAEAFRRGMLV